MTKGTLLARCVVCVCQFESRQKAGEISIRLTVKGGQSLSIAGPVCHKCASNSASDPSVALNQMRQARANLLMGG